MPASPRRPVDNALLYAVEDAVLPDQAAPVDQQRKMVRIGHLISGEEALFDLQVIQAAVNPADGVEPMDRAGLRLFEYRHAKHANPLHGRMAGIDLHTISDTAERIGTAIPVRRERH